MGNALYPQRMLIDRLITTEPYKITVGVTGQKSSLENPMGEQVIRIDENGPLRSLVAFMETPNSLNYTFEGDVSLMLTKRENGEIVYHVKTPEISYTDKVNPFIRKHCADHLISLKSQELDKIFPFVKIPEDS